MNTPHKELIITVSKTADGENDYLQILSGDQWSLNIVLIADIVEIRDRRSATNAKN